MAEMDTKHKIESEEDQSAKQLILISSWRKTGTWLDCARPH